MKKAIPYLIGRGRGTENLLSCPVTKQVSDEQDFQTKSSNSESHALPNCVFSNKGKQYNSVPNHVCFEE